MLNNDGYALLIGIDDYSAFDRSREQEIGTSDLLGSRNDVRTFWRLCRKLGMKAENIRVLVSPPLSCDELEGASPENVAPATASEILNKVAWLAEKLSQPSRPTGLMTYSGHGDVTEAGLALCPSDIRYGEDRALENAVSFGALDAIIRRHDAGENLTIVLDTCHAGSAAGLSPESAPKRPLSLLRRSADELGAMLGATPPLDSISARVLAAARPDEVAYQSELDGRFRGVFSWAVCAAMEQWKMTPEGNTTRLDVSYGKLVETTQRLVSALWFDQRPELRGPDGLADLAVFHPGLHGHAGETAETPNAKRLTQQIDPSNKGYVCYTLSLPNGTTIGKVIVTNTSGAGFDANREYWYLTQNVSMGSAITFTSGAAEDWTNPPSGLGTLSFKTNRTPTWTSGTPSASTTLLLETNVLTGERIGINWQMTVSHGSWGGSITWWHNSQSNIFGPSETNTLSPGLPASGTWYYYTTAPLP
ncbi:MAG: caspase family protein [Minicystis sp.]